MKRLSMAVLAAVVLASCAYSGPETDLERQSALTSPTPIFKNVVRLPY